MARSRIEWTDESWNLVGGCTKVSPGCDNCYALRDSYRIMHNKRRPDRYEGVAGWSNDGPEWTGRVNLDPEALVIPRRWRKQRLVFVCSMSDLFHRAVPDAFIKRVWGVMARTPQHTYQVLTKRSKRMREWVSRDTSNGRPGVYVENGRIIHYPGTMAQIPWPLPNVWLGVTGENQEWVEKRVPDLLQTPAAVRFLSIEPMLGRVELTRVDVGHLPGHRGVYANFLDQGMGPLGQFKHLDWVIVGCESGSRRRRLALEDSYKVVADCSMWNVPVFVKQLDIGGQVSKDPREWPEGQRVRQWPTIYA